MRAVLIVAILWVLTVPLAAQQASAPQWEYGRLTASSAAGLTVPSAWSAGDSTVSTDSLVRSFASHTRGSANQSADPLLYVMNELGRQGWEFVQAIPQFGFVFKRRKG
jgi:hypothetical protein